MSENEFAELLSRARQLEDPAIERVLRHVEDRLRRYVDVRLGPQLRTRLRDSDILQNAYVEMLRSLPTFVGSSEDEFVAWVTKIIENDIRRQNRWFGAGKRQAPERTSERNILARTLLEDPPTPSATLSQVEERALLATAMQRLPEHYAEIIELVVIRGLPHEAAAKAMGKSATSTRMLLSRARAALSLEIEKLEGGAGS